MVFNFADDSRNLVFRKGSSSIDYEAEQYYLTFKSLYSNNYLPNTTSNTQEWWDGNNSFYIFLTKVDDNENYISFSWDSSSIDGFGTALPSLYTQDDIAGYYVLEIRGTNLFPVINRVLVSTTCKVINDWSTNIDTTNKATRIEEDGAEFIYYRG
jgi:hypothetical protein